NPFFGVITDPNSPLSGPTVLRNQLLRPFPQYTYLNYTRSLPGASSAYDALTLKYTKQFSSGLSLISSYVWSKALDNGSEDYIGWAIGGLWRDSYNTKLDYGISMHDVPHSFATAFVYELPYGRGKAWGGGAPEVVPRSGRKSKAIEPDTNELDQCRRIHSTSGLHSGKHAISHHPTARGSD